MVDAHDSHDALLFWVITLGTALGPRQLMLMMFPCFG